MTALNILIFPKWPPQSHHVLNMTPLNLLTSALPYPFHTNEVRTMSMYVNGQQKIPYIHMSMVPSISSVAQNKPSSPQSPHLSKRPHLNLLSCPKWPPSMSSLSQSDLPQSPHLEKIWSPNPSQIPSIALTIYRAALSSAISSPWKYFVPISPSIAICRRHFLTFWFFGRWPPKWKTA